MKTEIQPPAESQSLNSRENPCYDIDPHIATLNVLADDEGSFQLPYAQFLYSKLVANPALEKEPNASPQKLSIYFAVAEVTVLGSGLKAIDRAIQKNDLKFVQRAALRYVTTLKPYVASVSITFTEDKL